MSYSQLLDTPGFRPGAPGPAAGDPPVYWYPALCAVIVGALTFNFLLAFVNTNITGIRESYVILSELVLISSGLLLVLDRKAGFYVLLAVFLSYLLLIFALRPELDLKAIRDGLIPIVFYTLGRKLRSVEDADRIIMICAGVVIAVGLFEFLLLDVFTSVVNIFSYYVARGTLQATDNFFLDNTSVFISSIRLGGRNFFPFLGDIRASSVFLEPVTMGNFGAFLCLWAVFREDMDRRWLLFALAFIVIILGDARFGLFVCVAFFLVLPIYRVPPRIFLWLMPFLVALALALYGAWTAQIHWEDNLAGRILHSAQIMNKLDWQAILGLAADTPFVADNGYAYTATQIGLIGFGVLWGLFIFSAQQSDRAQKFKLLATVFVCLLLVVSNSIYSIKLAALFWLAAGAADLPALSAKAQDVSSRRPARQGRAYRSA
jgi:putative polymerase